MGGLVSAYAMCEYPEVFGAAACLSTHRPACQGEMEEYLSEHLPDPAQHRFYFDYGTKTLDSGYEPYQLRVDHVMLKKGFTKEDNWQTRKFNEEDHSEKAWRERVDIPLRFLLADL